MIEFHDLMNKRKLDEREMEGSFVAGIDCDLSLPFELENKKHVDGQVVYEPEYGMSFRNSYMHRCFIKERISKSKRAKKSKNRQEMKRQVQEKDLKPISKAGSRPWSRKVKKVKKRTKEK
ncbi:hypothetical protein Tco_1441929 [Tanacetum coccineum]